MASKRFGITDVDKAGEELQCILKTPAGGKTTRRFKIDLVS